MFTILSFLCYAFAVVDWGLSWFGIDITGFSWSPLVAGGVGAFFGWIAKKSNPEESDQEVESRIESTEDDVSEPLEGI